MFSIIHLIHLVWAKNRYYLTKKKQITKTTKTGKCKQRKI